MQKPEGRSLPTGGEQDGVRGVVHIPVSYNNTISCFVDSVLGKWLLLWALTNMSKSSG